MINPLIHNKTLSSKYTQTGQKRKQIDSNSSPYKEIDLAPILYGRLRTEIKKSKSKNDQNIIGFWHKHVNN